MNDLSRRADVAADQFSAPGGWAGTDGQVPRLGPVGAAATAAALARRAVGARAGAEALSRRGGRAVAITIVDRTGVARVKAVPVTGLEHAARWGVGLSPVYAVATVDESFTGSESAGGPGGDLRLMPDLSALRTVPVQPGWAWAPADQYTQD